MGTCKGYTMLGTQLGSLVGSVALLAFAILSTTAAPVVKRDVVLNEALVDAIAELLGLTNQQSQKVKMVVESYEDCDFAERYRRETSTRSATETLELVSVGIGGGNITVGIPRAQHINCPEDTSPQGTCSWTLDVRYLGTGYFPSYVVQTNCNGCEPSANRDLPSLPLFLSKKVGWRPTAHDSFKNVGCVCST